MSWTELADEVLKASVETFGVAATFMPAAGAAFALIGVYDEPHFEVTQQDVAISSSQPSFGVRLADFPPGVAPAQDDRLTIGAEQFRVVDVERDGQGGARLILHRA